MKIQRDYPQVIITRKGEKWLDNGHPWLYESDINTISGKYDNGDIVDVIGPKGKYLGTGFINEHSKIRVRIFCRDASASIDREYWKRTLEYAVSFRETLFPDGLKACRLVFGESDRLPGLTIDKFDDVLVSQITVLGMDLIKDTIYELLTEILTEKGCSVYGIYERNDLQVRELEHLSQHTGWWKQPEKDKDNVIIMENGLRIMVDFKNGQKTGYFLDQRDNRRLVSEIARGKKVLDCFTHTGSFALNCAAKEAESVTAVDISQTALKQAQINAELNGLEDRIRFVQADVFDYLDNDVRKKAYDLIILDPPAFTKSKKTVDYAYKGYLNINMKAMQLLGRGGYLATCSCSHFMPYEMFEKMLREACYKTGFQLKQISATQQGRDHPILMSCPETDYLKFYIFQVI